MPGRTLAAFGSPRHSDCRDLSPICADDGSHLRKGYVTCREARILPPDQRIALMIFLAEHASGQRGVTIPDGEMGVQLASLVRGGCTLSPDAYPFTVIDRAVAVELRRLPKR